MSIPSAHAYNRDPYLFPLPADVIEHEVALFGALTEVELLALRDGNLDSLPSNSRQLYLLEGRPRPGMPAEHLPAYQSGACLGVGMYRYQLRQMREAGFLFEEPPFDPNTGPIFGQNPGTQHWEEVDHDVHTRLDMYLAPKSGIATVGLLKARWVSHGVSFMAGDNLPWGNDDYISMGLGDALALYAGAYASRPSNR